MLSRSLQAIRGILWPAGRGEAARRGYEAAAEAFFGQGRAFAFWKGRIALYAILRALGVSEGDEVLVPGYTCVMVPGPVIYAGAKPVYVDIDPHTYNVRPEQVAEQVTERTRAILVQHTYGLPAPVREIREIAEPRGIPIIEDCCHTFGGKLDGQFLGAFGDAAFFSGQWNKPFVTGVGGLALVHDSDLAERVAAEQASYPPPGTKQAFMLAAQLLAYETIVFPSVTPLITRMFRWMTAKGLVVGSSSSAEFEPVMPEGYARGPAPIQSRLGRAEIGRIGRNLSRRSHATQRYIRELPKLGYAVPPVEDYPEAMILRFPVRTANKPEALDQASRHGVEIGSWFECPLHPIETDQEAFGYVDGTCPAAEKAAHEVINLPTHRRVSDRTIDKTLQYLRDVCEPAEPA